MSATEKRLIIEQGATFKVALRVDKSFAGYAVAGKVRNSFTQPSSLVIATFVCTDVDANGWFTLNLTATDTGLLRRPVGARWDEYRTLLGHYDADLTSGVIVVRAYHGPVYLDSRTNR